MHRLVRLASVSWLAMVASFFVARETYASSCATPADCQGGTPICHLFVCAPCASDHGAGLPFDCTDPAQPICQTQSGGIGGSCTQCGAGKTALCDADHPTCLADGTCGCTVSTDCSGGRTCDQGTHACVPGIVDGGTIDSGAKDGGSSDGGSSDGSVNDGGAGDGSVNDGSTGDGSANDGGENDGGENDGAASDGAASADGATTRDGSASNGGEAGSGDGGLLDGAYVEGGGCSCSSTEGGAGGAGSALTAIAALVVLRGARRRRSAR